MFVCVCVFCLSVSSLMILLAHAYIRVQESRRTDFGSPCVRGLCGITPGRQRRLAHLPWEALTCSACMARCIVQEVSGYNLCKRLQRGERSAVVPRTSSGLITRPYNKYLLRGSGQLSGAHWGVRIPRTYYGQYLFNPSGWA